MSAEQSAQRGGLESAVSVVAEFTKSYLSDRRAVVEVAR